MSDNPNFDPNYPNRPQHPDFYLMCEKQQTLDAQAGACITNGVPIDTVLERFADVESVDYLAHQRALRMITVIPVQIPPQVLPIIIAAVETAWTEGFYIGNMFQGAKAAEPMTVPDTIEDL